MLFPSSEDTLNTTHDSDMFQMRCVLRGGVSIRCKDVLEGTAAVS